MKYLIYPVLIAFTCMLIACTKHRGDIEESIPVASIQFFSPTINGVYHSGDSIAVRATAVSTETVHGYDVIIRKTGDTTRYFFRHIHDHNDTLSIDTKWKADLDGPGPMEAQIILYLDHEGHTKDQKAAFHIQ